MLNNSVLFALFIALGQSSTSGPVTLPYKLEEGCITVPCTVNGTQRQLAIMPTQRFTTFQSVADTHATVMVGTLPVVKKHYFAGPALPVYGALGYDALQHFALGFDRIAQTVTFWPYSPSKTVAGAWIWPTNQPQPSNGQCTVSEMPYHLSDKGIPYLNATYAKGTYKLLMTIGFNTSDITVLPRKTISSDIPMQFIPNVAVENKEVPWFQVGYATSAAGPEEDQAKGLGMDGLITTDNLGGWKPIYDFRAGKIVEGDLPVSDQECMTVMAMARVSMLIRGNSLRVGGLAMMDANAPVLDAEVETIGDVLCSDLLPVMTNPSEENATRLDELAVKLMAATKANLRLPDGSTQSIILPDNRQAPRF
jgi:hypothetical protein